MDFWRCFETATIQFCFPWIRMSFSSLLLGVYLLMFVDYRSFLSFKFHWALLACLRLSLGTLGLPWVPLDGHWGSICHLGSSTEAPLEHHWAPFAAFGDALDAFGGHCGSLLASLCDHFRPNFSFFINCINLKTFIVLGIKKTRHEASQV